MTKHLAEMLSQAKWAVAEATKRGASGARVHASRTSTSTVEWRDGKLDRIRDSAALSLNVTLFVDGRYSSSTTSDLRKRAVEKFLDDAIAMTRAIAPDPDRVLPEPGRYAGRFTGDLKVYEDATAALNADWLRRTAAELEAGARTGSDKIVSVSTTAETDVSDRAMVASNGMEGTQTGTSVTLVAETSVRDAGGRKPEGWWYAASRSIGALPPVAQIGKMATERAIARVGESRRPTGKYPCVIEAMAAGRLVDALLAGLDGQSIQQRKSFLADRIGQRVGSRVLSVTDDPHLVAWLGSSTFDSEGMATRARPLFDKGVVKNLCLDTYYARKLGK
ncbi:MAG: TldD/PmbA family protein, partial [Polyangiaceae bacterium]|nr:TldD/PmbA family protein [Polyangiaceae bacterium]